MKLDNLIENQELFKEIAGESKEQTMDLSAVFTKLSELRNAHETSNENLRKAVDDIYDYNQITSNRVEELQLQATKSRQLRIKQLKEELNEHRARIERISNIQQQLMVNVLDWRSPLDAISRQLRKGIDEASYSRYVKDVQLYSRRYMRTMPTLARLQANPSQLKAELDRIGHLVDHCGEFCMELEEMDAMKDHIFITAGLITEIENGYSLNGPFL